MASCAAEHWQHLTKPLSNDSHTASLKELASVNCGSYALTLEAAPYNAFQTVQGSSMKPNTAQTTPAYL